MSKDRCSFKHLEAERKRSQEDREAEFKVIVKKLNDIYLLMKEPLEKTPEEENLDKQKKEMAKAMAAAFHISIEKAEEKLTAACLSDSEDLENKKLIKKYNELTPKWSEAIVTVFGAASHVSNPLSINMLLYAFLDDAIELSPSDEALFEDLLEKITPDDKIDIAKNYDSIAFTVKMMSATQANALQRIYRDHLNVEVNCVPILGNIPLIYALEAERQRTSPEKRFPRGGVICAPLGMTKEGYQITIKMDELMLHIMKDYAACRLGLTSYAGTFRVPPKAFSVSSSSSSNQSYILKIISPSSPTHTMSSSSSSSTSSALASSASSSGEGRGVQRDNVASPRLFPTGSTSTTEPSSASDTAKMGPR